MSFNVGPGIVQKMIDSGDEPRSDEITVPGTFTPHRIAQAYGRDALYVYLEEDNSVRRLPFEV